MMQIQAGSLVGALPNMPSCWAGEAVWYLHGQGVACFLLDLQLLLNLTWLLGNLQLVSK